MEKLFLTVCLVGGLMAAAPLEAAEFHVFNYREMLLDPGISGHEYEKIKELGRVAARKARAWHSPRSEDAPSLEIDFLLVARSPAELLAVDEVTDHRIKEYQDLIKVWCICGQAGFRELARLDVNNEVIGILDRLIVSDRLDERASKDGRVLTGRDLQRLGRLMWLNSGQDPGRHGKPIQELSELLGQLNMEWLLNLEPEEGRVVVTGLRNSDKITVYAWLGGVARSAPFFEIYHDLKVVIDEALVTYDGPSLPISLDITMNGAGRSPASLLRRDFAIFFEGDGVQYELSNLRFENVDERKVRLSGFVAPDVLDADRIIFRSIRDDLWLVGRLDAPLVKDHHIYLPKPPWLQKTRPDSSLQIVEIPRVDGVVHSGVWRYRVAVDGAIFSRDPQEIFEGLDPDEETRFFEDPLAFFEEAGSTRARALTGRRVDGQREFATSLSRLHERLGMVCKVTKIVESLKGGLPHVVLSAKHAGNWPRSSRSRQSHLLWYAQAYMNRCVGGSSGSVEQHLDLDSNRHQHNYLFISLVPGGSEHFSSD